MRYLILVISIVLTPGATAAATPPPHADGATSGTRIRLATDAIAQAFHDAMTRSQSFSDLVTTVESLDRTVYVEEGQCHHRGGKGCFRLATGTGAGNLIVRIELPQPLHVLVPQLAHELYHALEVARESTVVDQATLEDLYRRVGERKCPPADDMDCWETRAAAAFEQLVARELSQRETSLAQSGRIALFDARTAAPMQRPSLETRSEVSATGTCALLTLPSCVIDELAPWMRQPVQNSRLEFAAIIPKGEYVAPDYFELEPGRPSNVPNRSHSTEACSSFVCGFS